MSIMVNVISVLFLFFLSKQAVAQGLGSGKGGNLRMCIVEGRGAYKKAGKFCPILDREDSGIECVLGTDNLDCLRRMSKGTVDFGVFTPEDLIAAQWAQLDVLVINELRQRSQPFESSIAAVVNLRIIGEDTWNMESVIRNSVLCHPGANGVDRRISDTLFQYMESLFLERSCETNMSLSENRLSAMAGFFKAACIPGPWVPDIAKDVQLKSKYPSLCEACASSCNVQDAYWGLNGALNCMGAGAGDFTWVILKEALAYFKMIPNSVKMFSFMCRNGDIQPLDTEEPCVWLQRPWPVIVAKRRAAAAVSKLAATLTNSSVTVDEHWHGALAALFEVNQALPEPLAPPVAPLDYLSRAGGFREAYSRAGCSTPRHISVCTTNVIEQHKCDWLTEAATVYGIEPHLQCVQRANRETCFEAIKNGDIDVTLASSDWLVKGDRDYSVYPLLYETTSIVEKLNTVVALVRNDSNIGHIGQLRGKRAAFPLYDGYAWHAVIQILMQSKQVSDCNVDSVANYFGESCVPGIANKSKASDAVAEKLTKNCRNKNGVDVTQNEMEALRLLVENKSDVAFISMNTFRQYTEDLAKQWVGKMVDITPVCPEQNQKYCLISWSTVGQVYASKHITALKKEEITYVFIKIDKLFGKHHPFHAAVFSIYDLFNHESNVLFHGNTNIMATKEQLKINRTPSNFETSLSSYNYSTCYRNVGAKIVASFLTLSTICLVSIVINR